MSDYQYYRPNKFPPVVKNLIIINALIFVVQETFGREYPINNLFALHDVRSYFFKPHQIVTYIFMHGGWEHLIFNMLALWMFGSLLENYWGAKRFLQFYMICGIAAGLLHLGVLYFELMPEFEKLAQIPGEFQTMTAKDPTLAINGSTVGASGAIFGCLAAFGYLFPNSVIYIYFLFPLKAKWFVLIYGALELYLGIANSAGDNVAHFAHLGGAIAGIIMVLIWNKTNRKTLY